MVNNNLLRNKKSHVSLICESFVKNLSIQRHLAPSNINNLDIIWQNKRGKLLDKSIKERQIVVLEKPKSRLQNK